MSGPALADLQWTARTLEAHPQATDATVSATFRVSNTGRTPLAILSIEPDCGCTVASIARRVLQPGESGEIAVVSTLGDANVVVERTVLVRTDDRTEKASLLKLRIHPALAVQFERRVAIWNEGDQVIRELPFTVLHGSIRVQGVEIHDPAFAAELVPREGHDNQYIVRIKPNGSARPGTYVLQVLTDLPKERQGSWRLYAKILPRQSTTASQNRN